MDEDGSRRSRLLSGGEGTRSTVVTITSTVVFFGVIGYLIVHSAGLAGVQTVVLQRRGVQVFVPDSS